MNTIITHLQELGLNEKQARVYLALVEIGSGTAYAIAKQAKIKRPTTYLILEELRNKGVVLKVPHKKNQVFIAKNPNELFIEQEEKIKHAKRALPELLARAAKDSNKVTTYLFEGKDGVRQALNYGIEALEGKELLCYYAKSEKGSEHIPKMYFDHYHALNTHKVKIRGFAPEHHSNKIFREMDKISKREVISLHESEFSPNVSVQIADNFVRVLLHKNSEALIVENKEFAYLMKQVFELVWKVKAKQS